jgi:hypothetical protein
LCAELVYDACSGCDPYGLVAFFSLSYEENLPTWYSVISIFSAGVLLALIAVAKRREGAPFVLHWWLLAITFFYISLDELAELHEQMSTWFDFEGILYFGWVVPAAALVAVWGALFVPFVRHLPRRTRNHFLLAGALYLTGALVLELPLGWWTARHGDDNLGYALIDWVEETLEIGAMSLFLYRLVEYVVAPGDRLRIGSRGSERGSEPP